MYTLEGNINKNVTKVCELKSFHGFILQFDQESMISWWFYTLYIYVFFIPPPFLFLF